MAWLSLFRTSFFEDQQPLGIYMQDMVNASLQELTLFEMNMSMEELNRVINEKGFWRFNLDALRAKYPKRGRLSSQGTA